MVELLARTGMRSGELAALEEDAMVCIGDTRWLRPVGKLHNDRYVPLHPLLVELINDWLATRPPSRSGRLVINATTASPSIGAPSPATSRPRRSEPVSVTSIRISCATRSRRKRSTGA